MLAMLSRTFPIGPALDYEPDTVDQYRRPGDGAGQEFAAQLVLELMLADDGKGPLLNTFENYNAGNLDVVREMIAHPDTLIGLADGGAHVGIMCDATATSFTLTHWTRDRGRGDLFPVAWAIKRLSHDNAAAIGLTIEDWCARA